MAFFSVTIEGDHFRAFTAPHLVVLMITVILMLILYRFRLLLRKKSLYKNGLRYGIAAVLLGSELSLYIWYTYTGSWNPANTLPLQLCSISLYLSVFMLLTGSYRVYEITYFIGLAGATQAMLTPDLAYPYPHYRFFHFFIGHIAIILASLFMTWVEGYKPQLISIVKTLIFLNFAAFVVIIANHLTGGNYMFLTEKPANPSLLDFLGPHPWYIVSLEGLALIICLLLYLPFYLQKERQEIRYCINK